MIVFAILILVKYYQKNFKVWILLGLAGHFLCSIAILGKDFHRYKARSFFVIDLNKELDRWFYTELAQIIAMPQGKTGRNISINPGAAVYVIVFFLQFMENNEIRVDLDNSKISKKILRFYLAQHSWGWRIY